MRLIDADEVMIKLNYSCNMNCFYTKKQRDVMCASCPLGDAKDCIDSMSTIEAEPIKHGRWEKKDDPYGFFDEIPVCSECGHTTKLRETYKYCPNCGAKMETEDGKID